MTYGNMTKEQLVDRLKATGALMALDEFGDSWVLKVTDTADLKWLEVTDQVRQNWVEPNIAEIRALYYDEGRTSVAWAPLKKLLRHLDPYGQCDPIIFSGRAVTFPDREYRSVVQLLRNTVLKERVIMDHLAPTYDLGHRVTASTLAYYLDSVTPPQLKGAGLMKPTGLARPELAEVVGATWWRRDHQWRAGFNPGALHENDHGSSTVEAVWTQYTVVRVTARGIYVWAEGMEKPSYQRSESFRLCSPSKGAAEKEWRRRVNNRITGLHQQINRLVKALKTK